MKQELKLELEQPAPTAVLLNILGKLRWADWNEEDCKWDVQSGYFNGTYYMEYQTTGGSILWDCRVQGRYPTNAEWQEMEDEVRRRCRRS